jgi:hypothetical protein
VNLQTDFAADLEGRFEGAVKGVGGRRIEEGPSAAELVAGGCPFVESMGYM